MKLAFAASTYDWSTRWEGYLADHGPHEVADMIAERRHIFDREWTVLVIDATSPLFSGSLVAEIRGRGRDVLAVWDPSDPAGKDMALAAGVSVVVESDATTEELCRVVEPLAEMAVPARPTRRAPVEARATRGGLVVAVGGPTPAASTVALGLAGLLAKRTPTVVIDANDVAPRVAQLLGLAPLPNLATAVKTEAAAMVDQCQASADFWVLAGLGEAGVQWRDVGFRPCRTVIAALSRSFGATVVVTGPVIEDLGRMGVDRFAASRAALAEADAVVAVGAASPAGVVDLTRWVAAAGVERFDLHLVATDAPPQRAARRDVADLMANLGAGTVTLLPTGGRRLGRAEWNGNLGGGAMVRALRLLAASLGSAA